MGARAAARARGRGTPARSRRHPPRPGNASASTRTLEDLITERPISREQAQRIRVVDSHTGGEPTRVVVEGAPLLHGSLAERVRELTGKYDRIRTAIVAEPRGSDVLVGAWPTPPVDPSCAVGVIFFTNVGCLGMCGHGAIGLMVTLAWLGRLGVGEHRIETPVGIVRARLHDANTVSVGNVAAFRLERKIKVNVEGHGAVTGDIAWGGNWFFLVEDHGQRLALERANDLLTFCKRIKRALEREGITGAQGAEIDHVELFDASPRKDADSRNFVLCPGGSYDRSPCGTGTSAKLACLQADGKLKPGQIWRQESITGSLFEASYALEGDRVLPTLKGSAWVNGEATLILDPEDPHCWGIRPA